MFLEISDQLKFIENEKIFICSLNQKFFTDKYFTKEKDDREQETNPNKS